MPTANKADDTSGPADHHKSQVMWDIPDFIGKFHLNRMTTSTPIPGTAIRVEQERNAVMERRTSSLKGTLDDIETRRRLRVRNRTRKAMVTARVEVQATVGYRMDAGACLVLLAQVPMIQKCRDNAVLRHSRRQSTGLLLYSRIEAITTVLL